VGDQQIDDGWIVGELDRGVSILSPRVSVGSGLKQRPAPVHIAIADRVAEIVPQVRRLRPDQGDADQEIRKFGHDVRSAQATVSRGRPAAPLPRLSGSALGHRIHDTGGHRREWIVSTYFVLAG
jgi:hypothetical protein